MRADGKPNTALINRVPPRLLSRQPSPRNLGLAYIEIAAKQRDPEYLEKAWPLLREAAAAQPRDPALYSAIANLLSAAGRKQQAIEYYRRSLEQDPMQPDALLKLAALLEPSREARRPAGEGSADGAAPEMRNRRGSSVSKA